MPYVNHTHRLPCVPRTLYSTDYSWFSVRLLRSRSTRNRACHDGAARDGMWEDMHLRHLDSVYCTSFSGAYSSSVTFTTHYGIKEYGGGKKERISLSVIFPAFFEFVVVVNCVHNVKHSKLDLAFMSHTLSFLNPYGAV